MSIATDTSCVVFINSPKLLVCFRILIPTRIRTAFWLDKAWGDNLMGKRNGAPFLQMK